MKRVLIVTGGTGGHIFPALALAEELSKKHKVGILGDKNTQKHLKNTLNLPFSKISSSQIPKSRLKKITSAIKISIGILQSLIKITIYRPHFIFAFGGYSTFPTLIAATLLKRKIILHEQNAVLGKVNRIFARFCYKIALTFEKTKKIDKKYQNKIIHTGTALRKEILKLSKKEYQLPNKIIPKERKTMGYQGLVLASEFEEMTNPTPKRELFNVLIIGGSGGAEIFSKILPKAFFNLDEEFKNNIQIFQQCRGDLTEETFENYEEFNMNIEIDNFFNDMKSKINKAHLIISRAGSTSIHEFLAAKKPMILVPFAKSADNHQVENAKIFEKNNLAILVKEKDFTIKKMSTILNDTLSKDKKLIKMSENCTKYAENILDGTKNLVNLISDDKKDAN